MSFLPVLQVHIVIDAVSSQRTTDRAAGLHRAAQSGAFLVTSEMALFQLMQVGRVGLPYVGKVRLRHAHCTHSQGS